MTKYILTSDNFKGEVVYGFNEHGQLIYYINDSEMTTEQVDKVLKYLPLHQTTVNSLKSPTATVIEVPPNITLERFWEDYDKKLNLKRCKPLWDALSDQDKLMAIVRTSHYKSYCKRKGIAQCDPEKYLRVRYFDNDYLKIK